jgi:spore germination protein KC
MRYMKLFIIVTTVLVTFSGCFDAREIDDLVHITVIGIDKGATNNWRITVQFPSQKANAGSSGGGSSSGGGGGESGGEHSVDGYSIVSLDAPSLSEGLDMLNASIQRQVDLSQAHVIAISEEIAMEGISNYVYQLISHPDLRRSSFFLVTKGSAYDFVMANKPFIGSSVIKNYRIWVQQSKDIGYFPYTTLGGFYVSMKSPTSQSIAVVAATNDFSAYKKPSEGDMSGVSKPGGAHKAGEIPRISDNEIELWGTALFESDKMISELDGDETRFLLMLRDELKSANLSVPSPEGVDGIISLRLEKKASNKIRVDTSEDAPHIHVTIVLKGSLLNEHSELDIMDKSDREYVENTCRDYIRERIEEIIDRCRSLGVDPFKFGDKATKNFLTVDELLAYDWNNKFTDAVVKVNVELSLKHARKLVESHSVKY